MKILGVETTSEYFCIGIYDNGRVYEYGLKAERRLSDIIDVSIKRVLDALGWKAQDIDYFACGLGPGSFTGIRIGIATIKGLSWAVNKPVIGVPSLDILAANCPHPGKVVAALDARRDLIYCGVYELKNSRLTRAKPYMLLSKEDFFKKIKGGPYILGNAVGLYREDILKRMPQAKLLDRDYWRPQARNIIALVLESIRRKKIDDTFSIQPIYLYPKECQVRK